MRHSCFFIAVSVAALALTGCRLESGGGGSSTLNPAQDVDLVFSTFNLSNTPQASDTLSHTRFYDFYHGIEPAGAGASSENQLLAEAIRRHVDHFIGARPGDDGTGYTLVRNPLDLMNQVISVGRVNNFDEGRSYIRRRIAAGIAGSYNSRSNNAMIRFTDQTAALEQAPRNEREWLYPTLDWRYQPANKNLPGKVYRAIQYVARSVGPAEADQQPELLSLLAGSRYNANEFTDIGYNRPEFATVDYLSRNHGGIELRQEYATPAQTDTLYIKNTDQQVLDLSSYPGAPADSSPDCLRIELDYAMDIVRIFATDGVPARIPDPGADPADHPDPDKAPQIDNPDNCAFQSADLALTEWSATSSPDRK
ncbi:MAG TPA: hypothetical protein VKY53_05730 [Marinobacter sp.]|nr:hypothetical protein [Marinobacter sp.]